MRIVQDYIRKILRQGAKVGPKTIEAQAIPVPVLWLLGKTGAGKSSLIRALTGEAEVGEGFAPCTRTAMAYDYPPERPVMRFLDTRGVFRIGLRSAGGSGGGGKGQPCPRGAGAP